MKNYGILFFTLLLLFCLTSTTIAQQINDVNTPLHLLQPDYPVKYGKPDKAEIIKVVDRIYNYLNENTPAALVDGNGTILSNFNKIDENCKLESGIFRLTSL